MSDLTIQRDISPATAVDAGCYELTAEGCAVPDMRSIMAHCQVPHHNDNLLWKDLAGKVRCGNSVQECGRK